MHRRYRTLLRAEAEVLADILPCFGASTVRTCRMRGTVEAIDRRVSDWMERYGHVAHRIALGAFFLWAGILKSAGIPTATSVISHVIYAGSPEVIVPLLGVWEALIGLCLVFRFLNRVAILLLAVRLPFTAAALVVLPDVCFAHVPWEPTVEGQYLVKDILLFTAAMVIGGTVRKPAHPRVIH